MRSGWECFDLVNIRDLGKKLMKASHKNHVTTMGVEQSEIRLGVPGVSVVVLGVFKLERVDENAGAARGILVARPGNERQVSTV